ncbi:hypothetical protein F5Y00DRAFT_234308 [Daldinia vernicosa]|uniref:uncharacterized protein n=1 Tax=Daldinia vernicosa TaxID=114800 RepID=UPI0020077B13|nr:uncharacterized protein F5Y00DRAFT_234308 [Daldinia vernicosa]KAI0849960.1 hypothetical protein F5Y00DRAFT_234308 [Daldinia vernicosa]
MMYNYYKTHLYNISQHDPIPESYNIDENDIDFFESTSQEPLVLVPDHPLARVVDELKLSALKEFYLEENRSETFPQRNLGVEQRADNSRGSILRDAQFPLKRQFACPFYRWDPIRHMSCFTRLSLRGIADVKRHLWNAHKLPPYCPMCGKTFPTVARCDGHIRRRNCVLRELPTPEGITIQQVQQLVQPTDAGTPEELQWLSIWTIVFPGADLPAVTYPSGVVESTVCQFRDYWAYNGERLVSDFLEAKGLHNYNLQDEDHSFAALCITVLYQATDYLVESLSHETSNESIGEPSRS